MLTAINPQVVHSAFISFVEALVNNALKLDPGTLNQLNSLQGSVIHIQCTAPPLNVHIIPHSEGVILQANQKHPADCSITGTAFALLRLTTAENKAEILLNEDIQITGDTELSQKLQAIVANLDIDWEAKIAEFVGDIAAHEIGNHFRGLFKWGKSTLDSLFMDVEEYLHEEARSLPPRAELEAFYQDIEQLSMRTDRLSAKMDRLQIAKNNSDTPNETKESQV